MTGRPIRAFLARGHERKARDYATCPECGRIRRLYPDPLREAPLICATCRRVKLWDARKASDADTKRADPDTR